MYFKFPYFPSEDTELLKEMMLSIPLHLTNVHEFPGNKKYKVAYQISSESSNKFDISIFFLAPSYLQSCDSVETEPFLTRARIFGR
jgi:hypothetical protein